jgi:hypothetical protein
MEFVDNHKAALTGPSVGPDNTATEEEDAALNPRMSTLLGGTTVNADITLDILSRRPELVQCLNPATARALRLQARIALAALEESSTVSTFTSPSATEPNEGLVGIKEAARILHLSVSYLAHKGESLPFVVHIGRRRLYSLEGIQRYIDRQLRT